MPAMLRHKPTGDLYIATQYLLDRTDMEELAEAPVKKAVTSRRAKKKAVSIDAEEAMAAALAEET